MNIPLVSIIIPLYNAEKFIAQTILSAINQTWENKEILVIDDGSTDDSLSIAKEYESENVKIFKQINKGASSARNYGLREAKGDYIQFLDADDLLSPNKIEEQTRSLIENFGKVAISPTIHFFNSPDESSCISPDDSFFYYTTDKPVNFLLNLYGGNKRERGGMICIHSWLTPRTIIDAAGFWNEELSLDDDGEYFCRVILASKGVIYVEGCFNYYRKYKNSQNLASSNHKKALESSFKSIKLKKVNLLKLGVDRNLVSVLDRSGLDLAIMCYPRYKRLSKDIIAQIDPIAIKKHSLIIGGSIIQFIIKKFGWKTAKMLQYYKKNYLSFNR